jgi:hypothetical protein
MARKPPGFARPSSDYGIPGGMVAAITFRACTIQRSSLRGVGNGELVENLSAAGALINGSDHGVNPDAGYTCMFMIS